MSRSGELIYRGSPKHKSRPALGHKGTRCPEWTHDTPGGGLGSRVDAHAWEATEAAALLAASRPDPDGSGKRFATARGIAFAGHDTRDGTWHGYPVPWNDVPPALVAEWQDMKLVRRRDIRRYGEFEASDIDWALGSDDE